METFTEARKTGFQHVPYRGGPVDGPENGIPPPPWQIHCLADSMFHTHVKKMEVPHTATVRVRLIFIFESMKVFRILKIPVFCRFASFYGKVFLISQFCAFILSAFFMFLKFFSTRISNKKKNTLQIYKTEYRCKRNNL